MQTQTEDRQEETYCLFCQTTYEPRVADRLERAGFECLVAQAARTVVKGGREIQEQRRLFPGYVFFRCASLSGEQIMAIQNMDRVIRLLCYEEGAYALSDRDRAFVSWLWQKGGIFEVSRAWREGDRIRIIDGPLKDFEGQIVQVNLKRKSVAVQLGKGSLLGKIWCSVEMVAEPEGGNPQKR